MSKGTVVILVLLIVALAGGFFYSNHKLEKESGEREGLKTGYFIGFMDAKDGSPPNTENLKERLFVMGDSTWDKAFLAGANKGYLTGYEEGKKPE
jgi:hypothetical protein